MFVDQTVSRRKFDRELDEFRAKQASHHKRGVWLMEAKYPEVFVILAAVHTKPFPTIAFGVVLDFADFDVVPPSVRFVNALTREPLKMKELPHLLRRVKPLVDPNGQVTGILDQNLLQGFDVDRVPFVCLQGIREYHDHPGHTGDSWWLHRKTGVGKLTYILDVLATYAIDPIRGISLQFQPQITGFAIPQFPQ